MVEQSFVASALIMGVALIAAVIGLARMRDWRGYRPGRVEAEEGTDRTMDVVWVLWAVTAVAVGAIVYTVLPPIAESGLLVFGGFFALLLGGYLIWGVYHTIRTHGRKTAEAAMVGAWVLGGLAVLGISVLLVLG